MNHICWRIALEKMDYSGVEFAQGDRPLPHPKSDRPQPNRRRKSLYQADRSLRYNSNYECQS